MINLAASLNALIRCNPFQVSQTGRRDQVAAHFGFQSFARMLVGDHQYEQVNAWRP